jgi:TusA-related sulfurtransferase
MITEPKPAATFLAALLAKDFAGLAAAFDPAVRFRALVPGEAVAVESAAETVAAFARWFGDKEALELVACEAGAIGDRTHVRYRLRLQRKGEPLVVEQSLCGDLEGERFATLDLLCSGFRPAGATPAEGEVHRFDAGDLGCGTGLPREFRARLEQIPLGHRLEVATRDPAAREDLPALARMLGQKVLVIDSHAGGEVIIVVERTK